MKLSFSFGFNGGNLIAECGSLDEADEIIAYALKRGIVTITVPTPNGPVAVDITSNEEVKKAAKAAKPAKKEEPAEAPADKALTAADAAQAVKDYAAKHGVEAGRALLAKFNLKRTNEINDDNAAEVYAAAKE